MRKLLNRYESNNWKRELHFEKLKSKFEPLIKDFQSYQPDLREFLVEDAFKAEEISISTTYLVFDAKQWKHWKRTKDIKDLNLLGYITILTDSIRLDGDLKEQFRVKGIEYKSLPALKIGRLCVDDNYLKRNIGTCILTWVVSKVIHMNLECACRFITLDSKRHKESCKDSYHFYRKIGFKILKRKDKSEEEVIKQNSGATSMYLDLYHIIKAFKDRQKKIISKVITTE